MTNYGKYWKHLSLSGKILKKKGCIKMSVETEIKENSWCVWVDTKEKSMHLKETPNTKKIEFKTEEERIEFASKLMFKGYTLG